MSNYYPKELGNFKIGEIFGNESKKYVLNQLNGDRLIIENEKQLEELKEILKLVIFE